MRAHIIFTWCACAVAGLTVAGRATAQNGTLESRIAAAPADGDVRMSSPRVPMCAAKEGRSLPTGITVRVELGVLE